MKKLLFLMLIISIFYGCEERTPVFHVECEYTMNIGCENGLFCNNNGKCVHPCKIERYCGDGVCVKDPELNGEAQYHCECAENMEFRAMYCPENTSCQESHLYHEYYHGERNFDPINLMNNLIPGCFKMESCNDSKYCAQFISKNNPVSETEMNYFGVCNPNHECQLRCENDNDCIGENEYCHKTEKTCYMRIHLSSCNNGYFSAVEQKCVDYCNSDEQCPEPVSKCNNSTGNCVLSCTTDEECTNFKFSGGQLCDIGRGHCSEAIKCTSDNDCHSPVSKCNIEEGYCMIPCITDEDCVNGRYNVCDTEKGLCYRPF